MSNMCVAFENRSAVYIIIHGQRKRKTPAQIAIIVEIKQALAE